MAATVNRPLPCRTYGAACPCTWATALFWRKRAGPEEITLTVGQIPAHSHPLLASSSGATAVTPVNNLLAESITINPYIQDVTSSSMNPAVVSLVGGSHTNFQPYLVSSFIISLFGFFPSPT